MALDAFLIARPLSGGLALTSETLDPLFKSWPQTMELQSFHLSASNPTSIQGPGKISFDLLTITKAAGVNSPRLLTYCATGAHFDRVTLYVTNASSAGELVTEIYTFGTVFVMSVASDGANGDNSGTDTITMNFGQFEHRYYAYNTLNQRQPAVVGSWSVITNTPWNPTPLDGPLSS